MTKKDNRKKKNYNFDKITNQNFENQNQNLKKL